MEKEDNDEQAEEEEKPKKKKRKSEDGEVCALEAILDSDLKGFNCDEMDEMKIDTDTEIEV